MTLSQVFNITIEMWGVVFCIIAAVASSVSGLRNEAEKLLVHMEYNVAVLLLADVFAWIFRGNGSAIGFYMTRISNFAVFFCNFTLLVIFASYVSCFIERNIIFKLYFIITRLISLAGILLIISNIFTGWLYYFDEGNYYVRGPGAMVSWGLAFLGLIVSFVVILVDHSSFTPARFISFLTYIFLPFVATVIQSASYGISLTNITYSITLMIIFFVNVVERGHELADHERHMNEMQTKIMLSQIQPHFLYNSLTAIYYLCDNDPKKAKEAISQFSDYLRTNMDSLKEMNPVPFTKEMGHVENYLKLELLRFEEDLNIQYDIRETGFELPALSIQPIVENAVKYGVGKKEGGGTVKISTRLEDGFFRIDVEDNGAGFDIMTPKEDGRTHIGIDNVRARIESMVDGRLEIHSELGVGTHATIFVPDTHRIYE